MGLLYSIDSTGYQMNQRQLEILMHPKHIRRDVSEIIIKSFSKQIEQSVKAIHKWTEVSEYESKNARKQVLSTLDIHKLAVDIFTTITMVTQKPLPYISVASQIAIDNMSKLDSIKTACELIALLQHTKLYVINKNYDTRLIESLVVLPKDAEITKRIRLSCFLPPMIEPPKPVNNNRQSGYLTINDHIVLGYKENQHNQRLSLDVINTLNQNKYVLDNYVIQNFEKPWFKEVLEECELSLLDTIDQQKYYDQTVTFEKYKEQLKVLTEIIKDKPIYFNHRYDKRGRIYTVGYHFNTQGTSYEKACINLCKQELITGEL